ncbi:MAG: tetratricopeptide repeat protein [Lachnospiraceae bacterium]|nr:tetratricopeptide repeat protein [Lachnospiraceae bacterium]
MAKVSGKTGRRQIARHRIVRTPMEKFTLFLCSLLCTALVGVFFFMTWFMYNPKSRLAHNLKYGQRYLAADDYSRAVTEFRRVLSMDQDNAEAYQGLMEVAIRSEDADEAITLYGRATRALSDYREPVLRLLEMRAVERVDKEDFDGGFSVAATVEQITGDANEASLIRALVIDGMLDAAKKKSGEDAIALYRRILTVDNIDAAAVYERMAQLYIDEDRIEEAIVLLDEGIAATDGAENLVALRTQYTRQNASVFLPDSFIRDLNNCMAAGDFAGAAEIVRNELFLQRIMEFAGDKDPASGEQSFDFSAIQPADMNTEVYAEYNYNGQLVMLILDWERTTSREAVFHEMVYVPLQNEIYTLSQRQYVTADNTLADEEGCSRISASGEGKEIGSEQYYETLTSLINGDGIDLSAVAGGAAGNDGVRPDKAGATDDAGVLPDAEGTEDNAGVLPDEEDDGESGVLTDGEDAGDLTEQRGGIA